MKILLIEDDVNEWTKFEDVIKHKDGVELIAKTKSSSKGLQYVKDLVPDVVVLDLELNSGEGSGFEFLNEVRKSKFAVTPKIIVTTNVYSDSVYDYLHENKVDFIFYKKQEGYSVENVISTILLLQGFNNTCSSEHEDNQNAEKDMHTISDKIDMELNLIGIGTHLQGRKYLHDSILYILENGNDNNKISVNQYLVGKYKRPASTINRAMQNAIIHAWRISSIDDLEKYYTAKINYETGIPTPVEFIYHYVDKIKKTLWNHKKWAKFIKDHKY